MIIDAENAVLGRLASEVSEKAMEGEEITVINAEEALVTGNKDHIFERYKQRYERGSKDWGPHYPRVPDRIVKRTIKGMLPHKQQKGEEALNKITVKLGEPKDIDPKEAKELAKASDNTIAADRYVKIKEISKYLGWNN